jgi:signal transduction histidine kinase
MRWIFLRTALALILTILVAHGLTLGVFEIAGISFGEPHPESVHAGQVWLVPVTMLGLSLVLVPAVMLVLARPIARQLADLEAAVKRLEGGDLEARAAVLPRTELQPFATAFNAMASRRQADEAEREALLQAVAHELATPLGRIGFSLDFLRDAASNEERRHQIASIEDELVSLDRLMRELVAWVESGSPRKTAREDSWAALLDIVEERVDVARRHTDIALEIDDRVGEPIVAANPRGLSRVLDNLLRNAARYARRRVIVEARRRDHEVTIEVRDDGPGIPAVHRRRVFEPFARLEPDRNRQNGGLGLGLAIVARTVQRAGGRAWVEDAPEGGACFTFTWPAIAPASDRTAT